MGLNMHDLWMSGMPLKPEGSTRADSRTICALHPLRSEHGAAQPIYLVEHYLFPQPLQVLVFGEVKDDRKVWICPTGKGNVLMMIQWVVDVTPDGEHWTGSIPWTHRPAVVNPAEVQMAEVGLRRYFAARSGLAELRANGPWAIHPNDWRCPGCGGGMTLTSAGGRVTWSHRCPEGSTALNLDVHHEVKGAAGQ